MTIISVVSIATVDQKIEQDAAEYMQLAENLHKLGQYTYDGESVSRARQPLYPFLLNIIYWKLGQNLLVVKLFQAILGLISYILIMAIFRDWFPDLSPVLTGIIVGGYIPLWVNCAYILTESLGIFLIVAYIKILKTGLQTGNVYRLALSGIVLAMAILTKPIAISLLLLVWVPVIFYQKTGGRRFISVASILIGASLLLLPWSVRNYVQCGFFTPLSAEGGGHLLFASGETPPKAAHLHIEADPKQRTSTEKGLMKIALKNVISNPVGIAWRGIKRVIWVWTYFPGSRNFSDNTLCKFISYLAQWLLLILAAIGLSRVPSRFRALLIYPLLSFSLVFMFSYATARHLIPVMPFLLIATAIGILELTKAVHQFRGAA